MEPYRGNYLSGSSASPTMNISKRVGTGVWDFHPGSGAYRAPSDITIFSSSLPVLPHEKSMVNGYPGHESLDDTDASLNRINQDVDDSLEDIAKQTLDFVLPDDDELFSGTFDFDRSAMPSQLAESEFADIFDSVGGLELETDAEGSLSVGMANVNLTDGVIGNGMMHYGQPNGGGTIVGEHPYGEHPSRTLFVRNINSNVEDSELSILFEQYGAIRTMYTACKHRGFVMISYYDIRDARAAMRGLQNKPLRRRKLDIHFSIPKDNPSEKDINQGTLVVFNLDPSVSNEDLRQIFGAYGEVKEIRETPQKRHHKFIEFYDVRAADAALKALNRSDIAGKRIKLEPSRPGGTRRNLVLQQELELDESRSFRHQIGSPITSSSPGNWVSQFNSPIEHSPIMHGFSRSPGYGTLSPTTSYIPSLTSLLQFQASNSLKPIGKDPTWGSHVEHPFGDANSELRSSNFQHPHSVPELKLGQYSSDMSSTSNGSDIETLSGPQFLWGSPSRYPEKPKTSSAWANSSGGRSLTPNGHGHFFPFPNLQHSSLSGSSQHHQHHVGSAPSGIYPPSARHLGFFPESPDTSVLNAASAFGRGMNIGPRPSNTSYLMNMGPRAALHGGIAGNMSDHGSPSFRMMNSPRISPVFLRNGPYLGLGLNGEELERGRTQLVENAAYETESKRQFLLDLEKIANGQDSRTTLMIKNIPNKYTSKMLLVAIDETHQGTYDFLYLPIDFKNKCNVGYAFINMLSPAHIMSFYGVVFHTPVHVPWLYCIHIILYLSSKYFSFFCGLVMYAVHFHYSVWQTFNGKRWEKFNSEKVASLAYARIQGKAALVAHFQNSSLMNEDKRCRPIVFHSEGTEAGEQIIQEHLPSSNQNVSDSGESSEENLDKL